MSPFYIIPLLTIFPIMTMLTQHKHLLMILLSLEGMMLTLAFSMSVLMNNFTQVNIFYSLFLLALSACEAALGLSILVVMSRSFGTDNINILSINKC